MSNPASLKLLTLLNVSAARSTARQRSVSTEEAAPPKQKKRKTVVWGDDLIGGPSGSGLPVVGNGKADGKAKAKKAKVGTDEAAVQSVGQKQLRTDVELDKEDKDDGPDGMLASVSSVRPASQTMRS